MLKAVSAFHVHMIWGGKRGERESLHSNLKLSVYAGDDDSTTAAHIKQKVPYLVEKWTDTVHAKRSLTTRLYNLAQRGKFTNSSALSQKVINYLVKCFSYCVTQNKGNPLALQTALKSIVPHAFGDHSTCNESWCRAKQDPQNYKHSDLPYGKDLFGAELRSSVQSIFDEYCTDLVVQKLAPAANSQRNEALNSTIGSKNPKIRYYGGSASNDYRVACGISQANCRYNYISNTLESLNIEPGVHCLDHIKKMNHKSTQDKLRKTSLDFKRRRSQLHKKKLQTDGNKEAKEGTTYQSNIGLNLDPNKSTDRVQVANIDVNMKITKEELQQFEKFLPELTIRPVAEKCPFNRNNVYNFIIFDIETNSSGKTAEICQLSAIDRSGLYQFNEYILPSRNVEVHASRVNGLSVRSIHGSRTLYKEDQPVSSVLIEQAIQNFVAFLRRTVQSSVKSGDKEICTETFRPKNVASAVMQEILPTFEALWDRNLLQSVLEGLSQNNNEALNHLVWDISPKELFGGPETVLAACAIGVCLFNGGARTLQTMLRGLHLAVGEHCKSGLAAIDKQRLYAAAEKASEATKQQRQIRRSQRKSRNERYEEQEGPTYEPGAFGL